MINYNRDIFRRRLYVGHNRTVMHRIARCAGYIIEQGYEQDRI